MTAARPLAVAAGLIGARLAWRWLAAAPPGGARRWQRTNHRGEDVTLLEGPAATAAVAAAIMLAPALPTRVRLAGGAAALGAGAAGLLDDLGERGSSKGLRGHLGALRQGRVTTGTVKIAAIGATGLLAAAAVRGADPLSPAVRRPVGARHVLDVVSGGALIAGSANVVNLFDLRPGRALKVVLLHVPVLLRSGPGPTLVAAATGAAAGLLREDLAERGMLGDCGANALGAVLGTAAVVGLAPRGRAGALAAVVGLILASERVSFTRVIASTPGLRELDELGRRPR